MTTRIALVLIAGIATLSHSITPALSYYKPLNGEVTQRVSARSGTFLNSTTSSSLTSSSSKSSAASVRAASSRSSAAKNGKVTASGKKNCIQKAVARREQTIQTSLDTFYNNMSHMLSMRSEMLVKYWGEEKEIKKRDQSIRTVWNIFGQSWRKSIQNMRNERRTAWDDFRVDRTDCGFYDDGAEKGGLTADSQ